MCNFCIPRGSNTKLSEQSHAGTVHKCTAQEPTVHTIPVESMHCRLTLKVLLTHICSMEISASDITSGNDLGSAGAERVGTRGGGRVPKGVNGMAVTESGFC